LRVGKALYQEWGKTPIDGDVCASYEFVKSIPRERAAEAAVEAEPARAEHQDARRPAAGDVSKRFPAVRFPAQAAGEPGDREEAEILSR
jgi:hypothetical protein